LINPRKHLLMNKSTTLSALLAALAAAARQRGLNDTEWAARAGLRKETLSRLRRRPSCDFATLDALANVVGMRLTATPEVPATAGADGHFPRQVDRDYEERLLRLCASRSSDPARWAAFGPGFFMAGLAVMIASVPGYDRRALLALAESLHPGASEPAVFARWLKHSPVRPARFLPMLDREVKHAA
jgi:DNA-binding phage protein